jgi:hypothetical protein
MSKYLKWMVGNLQPLIHLDMSGGVRIRGQLVEFNCERIVWGSWLGGDDLVHVVDDDIKEMLEALIDGDFSSVRELSFVRRIFCTAAQSHDDIFVGHERLDGHHGRAHRPCFEDKQNSDAH